MGTAATITDRDMAIAINGASLAAHRVADRESNVAAISLRKHTTSTGAAADYALEYAKECALAAQAASLEAMALGREFLAIQEGRAS